MPRPKSVAQPSREDFEETMRYMGYRPYKDKGPIVRDPKRKVIIKRKRDMFSTVNELTWRLIWKRSNAVYEDYKHIQGLKHLLRERACTPRPAPKGTIFPLHHLLNKSFPIPEVNTGLITPLTIK